MLTINFQESDLEVIDEEEEEDYSQYVEEGESEEEADPEDIDDVEPCTSDSISITQVKKYKRNTPTITAIADPGDSVQDNINKYGEEELSIATSSKKVVDSDSGNKNLLHNSLSSLCHSE